jgi:hypothetical protein
MIMLIQKVARLALILGLVLSWSLLPAAAEPILSLVPSSQVVPSGQSLTLDVAITNVTDLFSFQFDLAFDPALLSAVSIVEGPFLPTGGSTFFIPGTINNTTGTITGTIIATADTLTGAIPGVSGSGIIATVSFQALARGTSPLTLSNVILLDSSLAEITFSTVVAQVQVSTPFAAFTAKVEIELGSRIDDAFDLESRFTLGAGSDGIDLAKDQVTLELKGGTASFSTTIPAGSFKKDKDEKGRFTFEGTINGVDVDVEITPLGRNAFKFKAEGEHADLTGIANPVTVKLPIGNDCGTIPVTAKFEKDHDKQDKDNHQDGDKTTDHHEGD